MCDPTGSRVGDVPVMTAVELLLKGDLTLKYDEEDAVLEFGERRDGEGMESDFKALTGT